MQKIFKISSVLFLLTSSVFIFPQQALAVCPLCTVAVGAGLGVSRWLGIDDLIAGLWVGALAVSSSLWLATWVKNKQLAFPKLDWIAGILLYLLFIPTLSLMHITGIVGNTFLGIDKIILGTLIGSVIFVLSVWTDKYLRSINEDQVFIYYQKVILPMLFLALASFLFHFVI